MNEPITTQAATSLATSISVAGTFFGVEYTVIGLAILGACIAHIYVIDPMKPLKMALSILSSFVLGVVAATIGLGAGLAVITSYMQPLGLALTNNMPKTSMLVAFVVSFLWHRTAPIIFKQLDERAK
jgi:hypothetical protein